MSPQLSSVNVNGTGKISVDFTKVPRRVRTTAEGDGLFKTTEITRQTQMKAAEEGPNVEE
jgi:hypothetical protein